MAWSVTFDNQSPSVTWTDTDMQGYGWSDNWNALLQSIVDECDAVNTTNKTGTYDLNGEDLVLDADGDSKIEAATDDIIKFYTLGSHRWTMGNFTFESPTSGGAYIYRPAGSASNPTYSFTGFSDDGFFLVADGTIGVATEGQERYRISNAYIQGPNAGSFRIRRSTGSVSEPSFTWADDTDTGLYAYGSNQIGYTCGNSVAAVMSADGFWIPDGVTAPGATAGFAKLFVDTSDGDLKVIFGDGTTKTIATDT